MKFFFLFACSWVLVAFGQPHMSVILSVFASAFGFTLFWASLMYFPLKKHRYFYSAFWFFSVQLIQLSWVATPTYQGFYIVFVYLGLALCLGAEFGVLSLFLPQKGALGVRRIFFIASLWTLLEWSRLFILCGFAWNPIGLSLTAFPLSGQIASIVGIFGLSFIVMVVNLFGLNLSFLWNKRSFFVYGGVLLFPYLFGAVHIYVHEKLKTGITHPYHVALVQTALLPDQKDLYRGKEEAFIHPFLQWKEIFSYIQEHQAKHLDLIVLPEYALPFSSHATVYSYLDLIDLIGDQLEGSKSLLKAPFAETREGEWYVSNAFMAQALANHHGAEVIMGLESSSGQIYHNAAFHFTPNAENITEYAKRVLVPLAEYLPFNFLKPLVARYGIVNFFTHGKEAKVIKGKHPISLSICYEECFPHIIREGRRKGGELFVNVTNDGWFPNSRLPEQHFIHGRVRAIENGAFLLRACNTGITAGVDSFGRTIARFENSEGRFELERGALFIPLDLYSYSTLYTFWGDAFILMISLFCLLLGFKKGILLDENQQDD